MATGQAMHDPEPAAHVIGLRDPALARTLDEQGYANLGPLLGPEDVRACLAAFDEAVERLDRPIGDAWFPTILLPESDVRDFLTAELERRVGPHLDAIFDLSVLELIRLDLSVKPPSPSSELGPHQDFSLIDERRWRSLYLWIPLVDTDERNGTLHVVPGSHRFTNAIRSQHVPAVFDEVLPQVHESAVRLDCRAGDLVLMVSGVVHFSPPNQTDEVRLAAHGIVKPTAAPLVFYYADDETPADKVECYELDLPTYVRQIREGRPSAEVPVTELVDRPPSSMTAQRFRDGLALVATGP